MSPIGDALHRTGRSGSSIGTGADGAASDHLASELAAMAENDSDLARAVDERLRGAKVRFDGTSPAIEAEPVPEPPIETGPALAAAPPAQVASSDAGRPSREQAAPRPSPTEPGRPVRVARTPATAPLTPDARARRRVPSGSTTTEPAPEHSPLAAHAGKVVRAIPFVLIILFLALGFDRTVSIISGLVMIGLGAAVVITLLMATSRVGRKTTSMPRDDHFR